MRSFSKKEKGTPTEGRHRSRVPNFESNLSVAFRPVAGRSLSRGRTFPCSFFQNFSEISSTKQLFPLALRDGALNVEYYYHRALCARRVIGRTGIDRFRKSPDGRIKDQKKKKKTHINSSRPTVKNIPFSNNRNGGNHYQKKKKKFV